MWMTLWQADRVCLFPMRIHRLVEQLQFYSVLHNVKQFSNLIHLQPHSNTLATRVNHSHFHQKLYKMYIVSHTYPLWKTRRMLLTLSLPVFFIIFTINVMAPRILVVKYLNMQYIIRKNGPFFYSSFMHSFFINTWMWLTITLKWPFQTWSSSHAHSRPFVQM